MKFYKCNRCNQKMLKKKDYGQGLTSYCYFCNGFFNEENLFIEEGAAYWDARYKRGYWMSMTFYSIIFGGIFLSLLLVSTNYWILLLTLIVPLVYTLRYPQLKKEKYFRD